LSEGTRNKEKKNEGEKEMGSRQRYKKSENVVSVLLILNNDLSHLQAQVIIPFPHPKEIDKL